MGINFIRAQKEAYEQKRDAARLSIDIKDLFERSNPDRVEYLFRVRLRDAATKIIVGLRLILKFESETKAIAIQNAVAIGDVLQKDAETLAAKMKESGKTSGMLQVLIADEPDFQGIFKVRLVDGKDLRKR